MAPLRGHQRDFLQVICNGLIRGGLRIYEVPAPDHHRIADRDTVIQSRRGEQYQFVPASYALTRSHKPYHFHSPAEVHELLHDLAPNLEQLVALASALKLAPSPHSVSYTQLLDLLADALADEALVLYIQSPFKRPSQSGATAESSAAMPGNRAVPLAPPTVGSECVSGFTPSINHNGGANDDGAVATPTPEEITLAKNEGSSSAHTHARSKVSRHFLESNGFTDSQIANAIGDEGAGIEGGIDLTRPVEVMSFPPPEKMTQYVKSHGFPGNWFDPLGNQTPDELGLSGEGRALASFKMPSGQGLLSCSKPIIDNWTNPNSSVSTAGGGKQLLVNDETKKLIISLNNIGRQNGL